MSCLIDTIRETSPEWQTQFDELENAPTLSLLIVAARQLARVLAVRLVEEILTKRAQVKTEWALCQKCGKRLQSKGFKPRRIKSIIGDIKWVTVTIKKTTTRKLIGQPWYRPCSVIQLSGP